MREAGGVPELLCTARGGVQVFDHLDKADAFPVDRLVPEADPDVHVGLVQMTSFVERFAGAARARAGAD